MRLIDADELRERMFHEAFEIDTEMQRWDGGCWIRYKMFEIAIESAPTVEEIQVCQSCEYLHDIKHGRWEVVGQPYMRKHFNPVCCSICKRRGYNTPYCAYCGAKMEVSE